MTYLVAIGPPAERIGAETHRLFVARTENLKELIQDQEFQGELERILRKNPDPLTVALHIAPYPDLEGLKVDEGMNRIDVMEESEESL
jgi:hypothetical protein